MVLLLTSLLLLLIIHRHLVDDCDDSLGVLHAAVPDIWRPGGGGREQYGSLKVGGGMREGEGVMCLGR